MFYEEGWVPLSDATADVFRRLQALKAAGRIAGDDLSEILAISVWDICDASTKIGVTAADGAVISASKELVSWADPRALNNEHVNLVAGTVGSTELADDSGAVPTREALIQRYGGFLNLPVVIPANNFQSSLTFLEEEVADQTGPDKMVIDAAKSILQAVAAKEFVTREIMRTKLGTTLSRRKFKMAWGMAAEKWPDLAEPNRWQGL